jgi:hypothetical protein
MADFTRQLSSLHTIQRDEITKAFRDVFATASGKRVLFWMLEQCSIYEDAYAGEMTNATHYRLGLQAGGRRLLALLDSIDAHMYPGLLTAIADFKETDRAAADASAKRWEGEEHDVDA